MQPRFRLSDRQLTDDHAQQIFQIRTLIVQGSDFAAIEPLWRTFLEVTRDEFADDDIDVLVQYVVEIQVVAAHERPTEETPVLPAESSRKRRPRKSGRGKGKQESTTVVVVVAAAAAVPPQAAQTAAEIAQLLRETAANVRRNL